MASEENGEQRVEKAVKKGRLGRRIAIAAVVVLAAVAVAVGVAVNNGDLAPSDAAAKYAGLHYVTEDEVTDYINVYREQMGLASSSDEDWATFLAAYNLTPGRLRYSTIHQLVTDKLIQMKADELGLQATEEEVDATVDTLRSTLGLGSDEILQQTLEAHGQTEEGLRDVYRAAIVKRLLLSREVEMPEATDEQVKEYLKSLVPTLASPTVKHTYCFRLSGQQDDADRKKITLAQKLRDQFANGEKTVQKFAQIVADYCDDDTLKENEGANGWDADSSGYSQAYLEELGDLGEGGVSPVFTEDDSYAFIWVDDEFTLPADANAVNDLDAEAVPSSLWSYLSDSAAYALWQTAGNEYIDKLVEEANVVYYPMPSTAPYNVDMDLANVQLEEITSSEAASSTSSATQGEMSSGASS